MKKQPQLTLIKPNPRVLMTLVVQSLSTKPTVGRGRNQCPKTKRFLTGTLEKCPKCGSDARIQNSRVSKKTGAWSRRCICKSCGQKFVAVYGVRPSDINPNYRRPTTERLDRKNFACKTCEHWWGGRCEKGETLVSCTSYESCV